MESAIKSTLTDIQKLEEQILSILTALKNDESLKEAGLVQIRIPNKPDDSLVENADLEIDMDTSSTTMTQRQTKAAQRKLKSKAMTSSQIISKKMEIDSASIPMDESLMKDKTSKDKSKSLRLRKMKELDTYALIEQSSFLLPVLDTWVFGMTLVNSSQIAQNPPELILNMIPRETDVLDKLCRVFTYSVQVTPLDVKQASMEGRNVYEGIPFQNTFMSRQDLCKCRIQPGCQVLVSATFTHPLGFCGLNNEFNLIASLCLNGNQLWSRTVPASFIPEGFCRFNEDLFETHQASIFTALGRRQECFKMKRLLSQGDKSPHKAVEKFLIPLGFEKITSDNVGIDTCVEVFASNEFTMLWGLTFKIEKCFRNIHTIRCLVSARSEQQMQIFTKLFSAWLKKESHQERTKGLKGLLIVQMKSNKDDSTMTKALSDEINTISELVQLSRKRKFHSASSKVDCEWIEKFLNSLNITDSIFMQHMSNVPHSKSQVKSG